MDRALLALLSLVFPLLGAVPPGPAAAAGLPSQERWQADVRQAMRGSVAFLEARAAAEQRGRRLAVVLDIDNTSLATEYAWPRPVRPTRRFARHARALDMGVFFVTGRYQDDLRGARRALRRAGYPVTGMCGREHGESLASGKQRCRRQITRRGWHVVASVGNRRTDFVGRNYERAFRLPSYRGRLS